LRKAAAPTNHERAPVTHQRPSNSNRTNPNNSPKEEEDTPKENTDNEQKENKPPLNNSSQKVPQKPPQHLPPINQKPKNAQITNNTTKTTTNGGQKTTDQVNGFNNVTISVDLNNFMNSEKPKRSKKVPQQSKPVKKEDVTDMTEKKATDTDELWAQADPKVKKKAKNALKSKSTGDIVDQVKGT
jgi:hypothetical protein